MSDFNFSLLSFKKSIIKSFAGNINFDLGLKFHLTFLYNLLNQYQITLWLLYVNGP